MHTDAPEEDAAVPYGHGVQEKRPAWGEKDPAGHSAVEEGE